ncbi:EARP and GARP complex-interacting protein 1 isoform c [Mus musculus]|uniref:EARP and GARP complex-interacting protein 1 isoform c n=2 Tax=Mus musculus TaxID=10090 RepID=UPI0003D70E2B|nr:EARP and GARP complex-interacting protein 1 isoform c [Mus musculus]|eukprot:XP_006515183.1 PREDICTED: protein TSSC1 isoform X1 [Mus musculus]
MEDDAPVIYGLEFQARALTPQTAETDAIRFLVGTQSLKYDNQIHIIDFDDENNIINKNVLLHQAGEIWHISASPADKGVLATCYNKTTDSRVQACAAVWRMPKELESGSHESPDDPASTAQTLELLCHLDNSAQGNVACVVWEPMGDGKKVISLADSHILLWDLQPSSSQAVIFLLSFEQYPFYQLASSATLEGRGQLKFTAGRWSPHHNCTQVATASDTTLRGWDTRSMSQIYCIENAHGQLVRDLDFNPNKQYYLASCGDDCKVKFWDTRNVTEPVKTLEEHSHWVWSVRYNHSHDQLVLTGSSDSRVILSNMVSISSEPFGHLVDDGDISDPEEHHAEKSKEPLQDNVIATYEEHEDSVYAVDWASADPWLFASLSYDGRLVINRVPRALKYHILL